MRGMRGMRNRMKKMREKQMREIQMREKRKKQMEKKNKPKPTPTTPAPTTTPLNTKSISEKVENISGIEVVSKISDVKVGDKKETHINILADFNDKSQEEKNNAMKKLVKTLKIKNAKLIDPDGKIIAHSDSKIEENFVGAITPHLSRALLGSLEHMEDHKIITSVVNENNKIVLNSDTGNDLNNLLNERDQLNKKLVEATNKNIDSEITNNNLEKVMNDNIKEYQTSLNDLESKNEELLSRNTELIKQKNSRDKKNKQQVENIKQNIRNKIKVIDRKIKAYNHNKRIIRKDYLDNISELTKDVDTSIQKIRNTNEQIQYYKNITNLSIIVLKITILSVILFLLIKGLKYLIE